MTADPQEAFYAALLDDDPQLLYERAPCGYLSTTADGTIIKVNDTFLALTGYSRRDLLGRRTFAELLTAGGRLYHETHYAPMLRIQGRAREIALEIVCADRRRLPVLVNSVLDTDPAGTPTVIRTAIFDATERRAYEQELLRAKQRAEASEAHASALARTLQRTLMPPSAPRIAGLDVATAYRPAGAGDEVGGDFYDVFEVRPDDWVVFIGDVCGKGVEAAAVTSLARYTLRAVAVREDGPASVLAALNDALLRNPGIRLCTVALARLRRSEAGWVATLSSAGHPLPLLKPRGGEPVAAGRPGTLLGAVRNPTISEATVALDPGDVLVFFTDGVPEGRRNGDEFYEEERLRAIVADSPADAGSLADRVLTDVLAFQNGVPRDDIALVILRVPE